MLRHKLIFFILCTHLTACGYSFSQNNTKSQLQGLSLLRGAVTLFAGVPQTPGFKNGSLQAAQFYFKSNALNQIIYDSNNSVYYVSDSLNHVIRKITSFGQVSTLAGVEGSAGYLDGPATNALLNQPMGLALDSQGNLYFTEAMNRTLRKLSPSGVVSTFAGSAYQLGSTDAQGTSARFSTLGGVVVDSGDNIWLADSGNNTIRKVTSNGRVTTAVGQVGQPGFQDGTVPTASLNHPVALAIDSSNTLYIFDQANYLLRKFSPQGVLSTLCGRQGVMGLLDGGSSKAQFNFVIGIAVDQSGTIYLSDSASHTLRRVSSTGQVTTIAGTPGVASYLDGLGADAQFRYPSGLTFNSSGELILVDAGNSILRKIN